MKSIVKIIALILVVASCKKSQDFSNLHYSFGGGVLILNEGNYRGGNGSLSFYSYDSTKMYNDLFYSVNGRSLGDVPNAITIKGDKAYIVVNNSGKIEVVDQSSLKSLATIRGLNSPRNITAINDNKAYVTSLYSDSVTIINLFTNSIQGYINVRRTSEAIVISGNKAFISNWAGGHEVMVISTLTDVVIDSVDVGVEPESMTRDKYGMIWVLCNGGYMRQNYAELIGINSITDKVEKKLVFPSINDSPSCLTIDGSGSTLFFIDGGVRQMDIAATVIPGTHIVEQKAGEYFYKVGINPINGDIFVTDAVDFSQQGYVSIYSNTGTLISKNKAGIIPASMCFKLKITSTN
jgi:DNA-binding beta-propeller fold protein YncE